MDKESLYKAFKRGKYLRLGASILMDLVGMATFLIPGIAEVADIFWAPVAAILHFVMYRSWPGAAGGLVTFVEEILPATDWIPSVTLSWVYHYVIREENTLKKFLARKQRLNNVLEDNSPNQLP